MTKTLATKTGSAYRTDDGRDIAEHTLYRFEDENGEGGCWYSTIEQAERSWTRYIEWKPARDKRRAEQKRLRDLAEQNTANTDDDPFAVFSL